MDDPGSEPATRRVAPARPTTQPIAPRGYAEQLPYDPARRARTAVATRRQGDCAAILAAGKPNMDRWTFTWTAPASGTVRIFYGAVDGNCDMMSMHDAVVVGTRTLTAR